MYIQLQRIMRISTLNKMYPATAFNSEHVGGYFSTDQVRETLPKKVRKVWIDNIAVVIGNRVHAVGAEVYMSEKGKFAYVERDHYNLDIQREIRERRDSF